ncbi:unnamed protein product [Arctogadus glacialis]
MSKSFPGIFRRERTSGKRRFPTPLKMVSAASEKATNIQFYLLPKPMTRTPQGSQELSLLMAGLGKRMISVPEHSNHAEISAMLLLEYPKLETLSGGWLFYKATGGSGQRKLALIPPEYTAKLLKSVSNNGRNMFFIVPIQEEIYTTPLPPDAPEFSKMPKSQCKTCGEILPLQVLAVKAMRMQMKHKIRMFHLYPAVRTLQQLMQSMCPICQVVYPADVIEMHASACNERPSTVEEHSFDSSGVDLEAMEGPSGTSSQIAPLQNQQTSSSGPSDTTNKTEDWKTIPDLARAAQLYRETILDIHASGKPLHLHVDLRGSKSDQEMALIAFYKALRVEWANPMQCRLEAETAIIEINDCPDIDLREKITLAIGWFMRQIKQIRKGLKETMLWPLISERPDVALVIFPRESSALLTPQCILERISWPTMTDDDDDDECSVTDKSRITGYLRQFIQNASSDELKALVKFWVGWEAPTTTLTLEVTDCSLPKSSTCFETLRLPARYQNFTTFKEELIACLQTTDTGFGLV